MSSVRELRKRLHSIKNIAKLTKAMQMVASSKMHRAQQRVLQSRPYTEQLRSLVIRLAKTIGTDSVDDLALLQQRPIRNIGVILVTPDRNMCGALPTNIYRLAKKTIEEEQLKQAKRGLNPEVGFIAVGRRGYNTLIRAKKNILAEFIRYGDWPSLSDAEAIAAIAIDAFLKQGVDQVLLVYSKSVNSIVQQPTAVQLLPVQSEYEEEAKEQEESTKPKAEYIYEPSAHSIFEALLPRYVNVQVYQALLETVSSMQTAQMVAMKNATDNAEELVQDVTLVLNKLRQTNITTEILEVIAGANALS